MEDKIRQLEERVALLEMLVGTKLSQEQARKYIGVSRNTIMKYREMGLLKPRRQGNRLYYNIIDLKKVLS